MIYENDSYLAKIIDITKRFQLKPKKDYYNSLLKAIVQQQLSVAAASSIYSRFSVFFNAKFVPEKILDASDTDLRNCGLSHAKVTYVKDLSNKILNGQLRLSEISLKSNDEIIKDLTMVKGIGVWSSHMFLIFTLGRINVLPIGDLGIRRAAMNLYKLRSLPDEKRLRKLSIKNNWEPYNTIASWYLWRSLEL